MKINLKGKGDGYIKMLYAHLKHFKQDGDKDRLRMFLKYADPKMGVISDRVGIIKCTVPTVDELLFAVQPDIPATFIVVNGTIEYSDLIREHLGHCAVRMVETEKMLSHVEKVDELLWVSDDPWHKTVKRLRFVDHLRDTVCLQALGCILGEGYCFRRIED